jgi:opacity protein-like surface antigen
MMGKFATASALRLLILTFLLVGRGLAQAPVTGEPPATPPQQPTTQPSAQEAPSQTTPSDQEPSEESTSRRKKPKDFKNWNYNVGFGANVNSGTTKTFVRAGGPLGTAGVARNASKYLGLRADAMFSDLPLRQSALSLAQAGSASSYLLALNLGPVINIPVTKQWGGYLVFGGGYYHRWGTLSDDTAVPGSTCNAFYEWWASCANVSIPLSGSFATENQNHFGYDFGAGVTRKVPSGVELYAEFRIMHGSGNLTTTDVHPITIGVRW